MKRILIVAAAMAVMAGCIRKETTHTLYLDPGGTVTWTILDQNIRSDKPQGPERDEEEQGLMEAVEDEQHRVPGFSRLGADWVDMRILRTERPYMLLTEARFDSVEDMFQTLLDGLQISGYVELEDLEGHRRLTITCDTENGDGEELPEEDKVLAELVVDAQVFRFVLTEGKFTAATGFEIKEEGTMAVMQEPDKEKVEANEGVLVLSLTWEVEKGE